MRISYFGLGLLSGSWNACHSVVLRIGGEEPHLEF